jgi:hypothetical protein
MAKSSHDSNMQFTQNQKNQMSDDPGDGARNSSVVGRAGKKTPLETSPEEEGQDQSQIEAFGEEGAGIASKE